MVSPADGDEADAEIAGESDGLRGGELDDILACSAVCVDRHDRRRELSQLRRARRADGAHIELCANDRQPPVAVRATTHAIAPDQDSRDRSALFAISAVRDQECDREGTQLIRVDPMRARAHPRHFAALHRQSSAAFRVAGRGSRSEKYGKTSRCGTTRSQSLSEAAPWRRRRCTACRSPQGSHSHREPPRTRSCGGGSPLAMA
jgi:hypothetical protein